MLNYFDINTCIVTNVFSYAACDAALAASNGIIVKHYRMPIEYNRIFQRVLNFN